MKQPQKRLPAEERKKLILKCAVKVFAQSNYRSAKMADIAAAAGVSEAMVYKYFPSKKVVFLMILQHMSERIITFWKEEVEKDCDAVSTLKNMGVSYYQRMRKHPDELKVQFQAISEIADEDIANQLRQDHMRYIGFIENMMKKGIQEGSIKKKMDTRISAFIYNGAGIAINMMNLLALDLEFLDENVDQLLTQYLNSVKG